jgi:hypothetical protein
MVGAFSEQQTKLLNLLLLNLLAERAVDCANEHDGVPLQQLQRHAEDTTLTSPTCSRNGGASVVHEEAGVNRLLALLMDTVLAKTDAVSKRLLLDFFVEMKVEQQRSQRHTLPRDRLLPRQAERLVDGGEILAAARGWLLDGTGAELWSLEDVLRGGDGAGPAVDASRRGGAGGRCGGRGIDNRSAGG